MLENIISLSDLLTRQKTYKAQLIDEVRDSKTKMGILYENVANGSVTTEEEAAALLSYKGPKDRNYKNLKGELYNRMINSIFFIDLSGPNYKDIFEAAINCYKNFAAIKIMLGNRKRSVAIDLAERTLKVSRRFEFTDLNYFLSAILTTHYISYTVNRNKYKKYKDLKGFYQLCLIAENDAEEKFGELGVELTKSSAGLSKDEIDKHFRYIPELRKQQEEIRTVRFNLYAYLYQANVYLELKNYEKIIEIAQEGIEFYKRKGIKSIDGEYSLRTRSAVANFLLQNYSRAQELFFENLKITNPQTNNWYTTYNLLFELYVVQGKFADSYEALAKVFSTKQFEKSHPLVIQLFKVKEAYIHFLVELGKIDPTQSEEAPLRKFRLNRFLNDVPTYSKDKRGVNISILIIQMILLVQNKKYNQVLDRLDALNMYSHRYLRSDNTFRSNCFIKMMAKLPDADYHPIRWARYVKKFRDRLDEHPFELSYHNLDIEVIPFENLYDLVLEMLEKGKKF